MTFKDIYKQRTKMSPKLFMYAINISKSGTFSRIEPDLRCTEAGILKLSKI